MKRTGILWIFYFLPLCSLGQALSLNELLGLTHTSSNKLGNTLSKKGFKKDISGFQQTRDLVFRYQTTDTSFKEERIISLSLRETDNKLCYTTSSRTEYSLLKEEMRRAGYSCPLNANDRSFPISLYQKENTSVEISAEVKDSLNYFHFIIENKVLPRIRDIVYAEDLLQLDAHEYLVTLFGRNNVKKEVFHFSERETNVCSVLFPNTSKEAIFIWNDQLNFRNAAFIIFGAQLNEKALLANV